MAKYTLNYACGHGSHTLNLVGKNSERERRLDWEQRNRECPDCYKTSLRAADDATPKTAEISIQSNAVSVSIKVTVKGQTMANADALSAIGIKRRPADGGFLDIFGGQKWFTGAIIPVTSPDHIAEKIDAISQSLTELGYKIAVADHTMSVDLALAIEFFRCKAKEEAERAEKTKNDPKPPVSPLRSRIAKLEAETGAKWNNKIYGRKGGYNFYINNVNHTATDAEIEEREANLKLQDAWAARNPK